MKESVVNAFGVGANKTKTPVLIPKFYRAAKSQSHICFPKLLVGIECVMNHTLRGKRSGVFSCCVLCFAPLVHKRMLPTRSLKLEREPTSGLGLYAVAQFPPIRAIS
jgi:hypothetical protein